MAELAITKPNYDTPSLPKRQGARGIVPLSWTGRRVKLDFVDSAGNSASLEGKLLDWFPFGLALAADGSRKLVNYDRIVTLELVE